MVTKQKLLVARATSTLVTKKLGCYGNIEKKVVTNDKKNWFPTTIKKQII